MRKFFLFIRVYWVKLLVLSLIFSLLLLAVWGATLGFQALGQMEPFSRRMLMGQMALFGVMLLIVHMISMPLMSFIQMFMLQGGLSKLFKV